MTHGKSERFSSKKGDYLKACSLINIHPITFLLFTFLLGYIYMVLFVSQNRTHNNLEMARHCQPDKYAC